MNDNQKVKHLFWRAGFGPTPQEWLEFKNESPSTLLKSWFKKANSAKRKYRAKALPENAILPLRARNRAKTKDEKTKFLKRNRAKNIDIKKQWMARMADPFESAFLEKMCLFWHGHFACIIRDSYLAERHLSTLREHALGNFRDLLIAISKDGAMLKFLNTNQNRKKQPNENYARELLELFTLGIGNYTEKDIQNAARAFTGWSYDDRGDYWFIEKFHDKGIKNFFGKSGNFDGVDIIDIILEKKQTAYFIASKVYRFFVNENINEKNVRELADVFYQSKYDIRVMMETMLKSDWFYHKENVGTKIKSPIELIVGLNRTLDIELVPVQNLVFIQRVLGQELFAPPSVKGWDGGSKWINNSTILFRINQLSYLLNEKRTAVQLKSLPETRPLNNKAGNRFAKSKVSFSRLTNKFSFLDDAALANELSDFLIVPSTKIKNIKSITAGSKNKSEKIRKITKALIGTMEYQLC